MDVLNFGTVAFNCDQARRKEMATDWPTLLPKALHDREFVIIVLENYWHFVDLGRLHESLRLDDKVLRLTFEKCQYIAYSMISGLPDTVKCIYALYVAGLQLPAEMAMLRKIVSLPAG